MEAQLTDSTFRIVFAGDLLSTNVAVLRSELLARLGEIASARAVVADLTHSRVVDSQGLNLLIALLRETERRKLAFKIENASPDVRRLLGLLNLEARLGLIATR